jgi:hypothetical protein
MDFNKALQQRVQSRVQSLTETTNLMPGGPAQGFLPQPADKLVQVAEEQARKIRKTQKVSVSKVTPLRISVPVRGLHYVFEQVLWVPGDAPVSVEARARRAYSAGWGATAAVLLVGLAGLRLFIGACMARRRGRILAATVLLMALYAWLIYV